MLWTIYVVLFILWLLGWYARWWGLIHLLRGWAGGAGH